MVKQLRVGLIGLGFIGGLHARVHAENPECNLVAVADLNTELGNQIGKEYGCKVYSSYKEMLEKEELDAVDICVPEDLHEMVAVDVARAKKDFIIEKPLAKTYKGACEIVNAAKENGVRLMVAHVMKFDPRYAQLKDNIKEGKLGEITSIFVKRGNPIFTANRLNGKVSFFYYLGIHDLEMMADFVLPAKPVKVYASASDKLNGHMKDLDTAFAIVTFDNGTVADFEVSWAYPNHTAMGILSEAEVIGTKGLGYLKIENQGLKIMTETELAYPDTLHWPEYNGNIQGDLKEELRHFVKATMDGTPYLVGTESCIYACAIAEAALKSIETGQPVELSV